jgi:FlaA1/EpsC-like NDP-sugar epimerase
MNILWHKYFFYKLAAMQRGKKRMLMLMSDFLLLPVALWTGFAMRFSEWWPEQYLLASISMFVILPFVGVWVFMQLGLYKAVVRFIGSQEMFAVFKGVSLLALFLWAVATLLHISPFPRSVSINFALVAFIYIAGSRLLIRHYYRWMLRCVGRKDAVLIYGAGGAGIQLAAALCDGKEYYPVGFVDDDESLLNSTIMGLPVYSPLDLSEVVESESVKYILLAAPNVSLAQRKEMLAKIEGYGVHVQTIPSMPELLTGEASIGQLREIQVEELLGREAVPAKESLLRMCITDRVVLVTGAGGSIGSELCRQILQMNPKVLLLLEISEFNLYQIEQELRGFLVGHNSEVCIYPLLADVTKRARVRNIMQRFNVDTVYHAAAYKHVPIVEHNIVEGVFNNVIGTKVLADESINAGVKHFILISTDKAVRPTNIMGATKRFSELVLQEFAKSKPGIVFSMVRFGNVLGSSGSVVPLFRKQIKGGGPLTVTHKEITRYFMTIPEAASLVIQAGSMSAGGDVFVLDMGDPVKIADLARRMVHLSGLKLKERDDDDGDISIEYTGLRPAEKLYEELLIGDNVIGTEHPKIMRANEELLAGGEVNRLLGEIELACDDCDYVRLSELLCEGVAGYTPHEAIVDHLSLCDDVKTKVVKLRSK